MSDNKPQPVDLAELQKLTPSQQKARGIITSIAAGVSALWKNDPVYSCQVHKTEGCAHVDGLLCDFPDCSILKAAQKPHDDDACCANEQRNMNGWCTSCGDPCL